MSFLQLEGNFVAAGSQPQSPTRRCWRKKPYSVAPVEDADQVANVDFASSVVDSVAADAVGQEATVVDSVVVAACVVVAEYAESEVDVAYVAVVEPACAIAAVTVAAVAVAVVSEEEETLHSLPLADPVPQSSPQCEAPHLSTQCGLLAYLHLGVVYLCFCLALH